MESSNPHGVPTFFQPLLWSYRFEDIDPERDQHVLIVSGINYGDLRHWRWLVTHYSITALRTFLTTIPATEFRPHVRRLVSLLFNIDEREFNSSLRRAH